MSEGLIYAITLKGPPAKSSKEYNRKTMSGLAGVVRGETAWCVSGKKRKKRDTRGVPSTVIFTV